MNALDLSRWQFGITTVYHFIFVPLTIGLSMIVAGLQTAWYRTGNDDYLKLTKFFGRLFLINFAMGVVTGIVQEFQFGMNWSAYSRFVGDIFGAPLAMEALIAFFMESTFLGLWIFGWDRLPKKVHLATIWLAAIGTNLSAFFILAANSWMQHPVGYRIDPARNRAELTSIWAVLTNSTALVTVPHVWTASFVTAGMFIIAVAAWHLRRKNQVQLFHKAGKVGVGVTLIASVGLLASGHIQGQIMTSQQPMKMAAAEALYNTSQPASFSLFTIGSLNGEQEKASIRIPGLLSFLATGSFNGKVQGINQIEAEYVARYGPGNYMPYIPLTYWSFRLMMGFGFLAMAIAAWFGLAIRKGRVPENTWLYRAAIWGVATPYLANTFAWLFTEMGRQPWTVFGLIKTSASVSPGITAYQVLISLVVYALLYGALAAIEGKIMIRYVRAGVTDEGVHGDTPTSGSGLPVLTFSY